MIAIMIYVHCQHSVLRQPHYKINRRLIGVRDDLLYAIVEIPIRSKVCLFISANSF